MIKKEIDKKLVNLRNELKDIANLYDLHIIEVINIFNNSLIEAYNLDTANHLVNVNINNQIIFYHIFEQKELLYNLSQERFNIFSKLFYSKIYIKNNSNMVSAFYTSLNQQQFIELIKKDKSRKYLTLTPKNTQGLYKSLVFKYKIISKYASDFIDNNETFWIKLSTKNLYQIQNMQHLKNTITLNCDILDIQVLKLLISHFLEKIALKTNNKINIRVKFYNHKNKIINLICSTYIPVLFIQYIENYIFINTSYRTNFVK